MEDMVVRKSPLSWWMAGLFLGMIQMFAVAVEKPLGVSTQFVVVDSLILHAVAPEYAENHPLISQEKYRQIGYGFWLDIGIIAGAFLAAWGVQRFKVRTTTVWWQKNHPSPKPWGRFAAGFIGGFLILLGARLGHGCTSGQFASGWAQLALSAVPFTIPMFGFAMITAYIVYPKTPEIET